MSDNPIMAALLQMEARLTAAITGLRVDMTDRMERFENKLTVIGDDIMVSMGSSNATRKANDNTGDDIIQMHEQLTIMWRQIKRLETQVEDLSNRSGPK